MAAFGARSVRAQARELPLFGCDESIAAGPDGEAARCRPGASSLDFSIARGALVRKKS
jgi:hypothetical protein